MPWFYQTYGNLSYDIQRADAIRYIVVYHFGGLFILIWIMNVYGHSIVSSIDITLSLAMNQFSKRLSKANKNCYVMPYLQPNPKRHSYSKPLKKFRIPQARKTIVVVDHSKFGNHNFVKVCDPQKIDIVVTDQQPPHHFMVGFNDADVTVVTPPLL
jgi:hypothetical protein